VLEETAQRTRQGAGTCVGHPFPGIDIKIIRISDEPIASIAEAIELPVGEIGEIIVRGPSTTREYFQRPDATAVAKIYEGRVAGDEGRSTNHPNHNSPLPSSRAVWHRLGDVGYLDEQGRLWFCGRKAHLVEAECGRMFTIPCEAIFNNHPRVFRSALVGVGSKPRQRPVIIVEPEAGQFPRSAADRARFREELRQLALAHPLTAAISTILFHRSLPVDIRHNVKIFREKLGPWAAKQLRNAP
jgi:acyl-CoA synthetase (AMP-forming)/AMP-acid ligase II